jgi:hypothetical protein
MSNIEKLRKSLIKLIQTNINKFDGRSVAKFFKIAYTAKTPKINKTLDFINNFLDQSNDQSNNDNKINYKKAKDQVVEKVEKKTRKPKVSKSTDPLDDGVDVNVIKPRKIKKVKKEDEQQIVPEVNNNSSYNITVVLLTNNDENKNNEKNYKNNRSHKINGKKYNQLRTININIKKDLSKYTNKYILDKTTDNKPNEDFKEIIDALNDDDDFDEFYGKVKGYLNGVNIISSSNTTSNNQTGGSSYANNLFTDNNYNSYVNKCVFSKYVKPLINTNAESFNQLFYQKQNEYVKENYKNNSCFINAIIENFKKSFDKKKSDGKRKFKELTYEHLLNILDIENNKDDNIGLSIYRAVDKFFKVFRLGLDVIYNDKVLIYRYRPEKLNKDINKNIMRVGITNDNHIYLLTDNIESFDQTKEDKYIKIEDIDNDDIKSIYTDKLNLVVSDYG